MRDNMVSWPHKQGKESGEKQCYGKAVGSIETLNGNDFRFHTQNLTGIIT